MHRPMTFWETLDFPVCGEVRYGLSISLLDYSNWNDDYIATLSDHDQLGVVRDCTSLKTICHIPRKCTS